jgi:hypothetical protein
MSEETKQTAVTVKETTIEMTKAGVQIKTLDDAWRLSRYVCASGFAPKGMDKPESVLIAMQQGAEIGLTPMQSLQSIAVINGRPGIYGDAALALVRASGLLESYSQSETGTAGKDDFTVIVTTVRKGGSKITTRFSVADAKAASLWGKAGPWSQYPARMLLFRARGFNLRDNFGDVLKGLRTTEELADMPPIDVEVRDVTPQAPAVTDPTPEADKPNTGADSLAKRLKKQDSSGLTDAEKADIEKKEAADLF